MIIIILYKVNIHRFFHYSVCYKCVSDCCYPLQGMVSRYPDVKLYHIVAVLAMRGDLNKNGCTKVQYKVGLDSAALASQYCIQKPP